MILRTMEGPMPGTREWHDLRFYDPARGDRSVIFGATDAAAACNLSPYSSPLELYLVKRREKPAPESNEAMEMGKLLEPVILELYRKRIGAELITELPMYFSPDWPFMAATPDAVATDDDEHGWGVDAKSSTYRRYNEFADLGDEVFGKEGTDQMPTDYVLQAQQQMEVLGLDRVDFPVLFDGRTMRIYTVYRNDDLIDAIVAAEKELAERIVSDDPPEPNWTHSRTRELIQELHGFEPGLKVELTDAELEHWLNYQRIGDEIKELVSKREASRNRVLFALQGAECGILPAGKKEIRRVVVPESLYTSDDVERIQQRIGKVRRRSYERLLERKVSE